METAITRERMITGKMTTLPAVSNQLLLPNTSTQHPSIEMSLPLYIIIKKARFYKSKTNPKFTRGVVHGF